jgi:hypothetical protein
MQQLSIESRQLLSFYINHQLPFERFHAKFTFTVAHAQTSAYGQKWLFHCIAAFSPSPCVHANTGQQSAAAIHFLNHVWHYRQPIKKPGWTNVIPYGQTLAFLFKGFGGKGRAKRATISFLAETRGTLARAPRPLAFGDFSEEHRKNYPIGVIEEYTETQKKWA